MKHGTILLTTSQAAKRIGCSAPTVKRWCLREGLGTLYGRRRLLVPADLDRLRELVQPGPGNPAFGRR